jgi:hypothetical protein
MRYSYQILTKQKKNQVAVNTHIFLKMTNFDFIYL